MCKNIIFAFSGKTLDNHSVIGAGICDKIYSRDVKQYFKNIDKINLGANDKSKPFEIDYLLNARVASLAPDYVYGLALSVNVENAKGFTGGIIGKPGSLGQTSDGLCQNIGNGLSVVSLPGGPGMLIRGSTSTIKSIFINIVLGENRLISPKGIIKELQNHGVDIALIVTDGTGSKQKGTIFIYNNHRMEKLIIGEQ